MKALNLKFSIDSIKCSCINAGGENRHYFTSGVKVDLEGNGTGAEAKAVEAE